MSPSTAPPTFDAATIIQILGNQPHLFKQFHIKRLALFGSVARNEATPTSDLDFLVEFQTDLTLNVYMNLKFFLEDLFQKKVDLVIPTDLKPMIKETILNEAIYIPSTESLSE
ncbi:nucleotidyltransferase family protein [Spirulina major]|uniref:nucleotidyltransferase family protein n=1 Tax=Spirulina major TaxID=270636 RepID=UPI000934C02C|nr:nucleotidyltransferase family protein [Spirulina major]